jgi:fumarate hydratase class II
MNKAQIKENLDSNLSIITLLAPTIGYDVAAKIVQEAHKRNSPLAGAAEGLGLYSRNEFETILQKHTQ